MSKYTIVGQGLAGSILAYTLHKRGHDVSVIDKGSGNTSSRAAAGIILPMVFRRTLLSWKAPELIEYLEQFYPGLEKELDVEFYHPMPYLRLFATTDERKTWEEKLETGELLDFAGGIVNGIPGNVNAPFGGAMVNHTGWINMPVLLDALRNYFKEHKLLVEEEWVPGSSPSGITIFAEGYKLKDNPYFNYLPFKPVKGEVLTVECGQLQTQTILNRKVFILPQGDNQYKTGSNYQWDWEDLEPTEKAKNEILEKLEDLVKVPYTVVNHQAGIRPASADRRPLIGLHPEHKNLGIFNGMGAKGTMLIPYFVSQFADYLEGKGELDAEVNINRYAI